MKPLFIRPLDVWLFRNGKPFNAGSDHRAETVFPPLPTVLQGAIRTHYIELHGGIPAYLDNKLPNVENKVGAKGQKPPDSFQLRGGFLARHKDKQLTCYVPLPAHAYLDGDSYRLLKPKVEENVMTDLGDKRLLWRSAKPTKEGGGGWLSLANLRTLLQESEVCKGAVKPNSCFFERESRLGIELDHSRRTTKTGMLYQTEFVRLKEECGLYVTLEGLDDWPEKGVFNMGGESHAAVYETVNGVTWDNTTLNSNRFTITFLTPTYFEQGWQPASWQKFVGDSAKCVAAAVSKPLVLGGFDVAHKQHKASRRYIPTGSTYYFEGTPHITSTTMCDEVTENNVKFNYGQFGFGQFMLGAW